MILYIFLFSLIKNLLHKHSSGLENGTSSGNMPNGDVNSVDHDEDDDDDPDSLMSKSYFYLSTWFLTIFEDIHITYYRNYSLRMARPQI